MKNQTPKDTYTNLCDISCEKKSIPAFYIVKKAAHSCVTHISPQF